MNNREIAIIFRSMATLLAKDDVAFKPKAYEKAAEAIDALQEDVKVTFAQKGLKGLEDIPGVGQHIAEKIVEFLSTGTISAYEKLHKKYPIDIVGLHSIEGLAPKKIKELYKTLGVCFITDLEKALRQKKVRFLPGFGPKSEAVLTHALDYLRTDSKRAILGFVYPSIEKIEEQLGSVPCVRQVTVCGSPRRMQKTIGDIDMVTDTTKPKSALNAVENLEEAKEVLARGATKTTVRLRNKLTLDVRVIPPESYGAAIQYFTGDKAHNIKLRERAAKKKMKLNDTVCFADPRGLPERRRREYTKRSAWSGYRRYCALIAEKLNAPWREKSLHWQDLTISKEIFKSKQTGLMARIQLKKWPMRRKKRDCPISRLPIIPKASRSCMVWTRVGSSNR